MEFIKYKIKMKITDKYVFFWGELYSQWYAADMIIDGLKYNCCEQYMMYQKALLFNDIETADMIMQTKSPKIQKEYGRSVKNFDKNIWDDICYDIVYKANFAKFSQNKELLKELLSTGDKILVEASPYDKIWGIGLGENHVGIENPENWMGLNLLGKAITEVKNDLLNKNNTYRLNISVNK